MRNLYHLINVFFWWFTNGAWSFFGWIQKQIKILMYGLSIRLLFKSLLKPLYGMDKFYERVVSIIVRSGHFLVLGIFAFTGAAFFYFLFFAYIFAPLLLLVFIKSNELAIGIYIVLLIIYLLFKEVTKQSLKKQINHKKDPKNYLEYANKDVKKIFSSNNKDISGVCINFFQTSIGKKIFRKLENDNPDFCLFKFYHSKDILLKESLKQAYIKDKTHINIEDVIQAIWILKKENEPFFHQFEIKESELKEIFHYFEILENMSKYKGNFATFSMFQNKHGIDKGLTSPLSKKVNEFTRDLSGTRKTSDITPLIGRDKEYNQILKSLEHRGSAVLIVGDSGSGKSRILEYLAERIAIDDVPSYIEDSRLTELDVGRVLSGDALNASKEGGKNLIAVLDEISKAKHIILTIDNLSSLVGDNFNSSFNLGILSKYIETGKINVIATTTQEDYDRFLNKYPTHIRRFSKIILKESSGDELKEILTYHSINFEKKYHTVVSQKCYNTIIDISDKHISDIANPAKSLKLLEEAMILNSGKSFISSEDIKETLAKNTGIKITEIKEDERIKLANLELEIQKRVIGQEYAVNKVSNALRRARLDLHDYKGPISKFLFVGPTGVGKTELAKTIAYNYFGSEEKMLRLDMSEFQEVNSLKRLIGDEKDPGLLTDPVKNTAHILVLLDEIEKSNPNILNLFLQILDDGRITDGKGRLIDFRNTIIIATSNSGAHMIWKKLKENVNFDDIVKELRGSVLLKDFRPEFLNRFNDVVIFRPLEKDIVIKVAEKLLNEIKSHYKKKEILLSFSPKAAQVIAYDAFNFEMGARPIKNLIVDRLESAIAKGLLDGSFSKKENLVFDGKEIRKLS